MTIKTRISDLEARKNALIRELWSTLTDLAILKSAMDYTDEDLELLGITTQHSAVSYKEAICA